MTNLDIFATILSEVTDRPASYWREVIRNVYAAAGRDITFSPMLETVPPAEAEQLLADLRAEKPGILRWVVGAAIAERQATPATRYRLATYLGNLQN